MFVPFEIRRITNPEGETSLRAVISMTDAVNGSNRSDDLRQIEEDYIQLIQDSKGLFQEIQRSRSSKADTKLHWKLGDKMENFLDKTRRRDYWFVKITDTLSRDIGLCKRYVSYHLQIRQDYPSINLIHDEIPWSKYQELLDVPNIEKRKVFTSKILSGEIRTREELRKLKKTI